MSDFQVSSVYENLNAAMMASEGLRPGGIQLTNRILDYCAFPKYSRLLDVGCGNGATIEFLGQKGLSNSFGLDISLEFALQAGDKNPWAGFTNASGDYLPFRSGSFDGVFAECSLSLINDRELALKDIHRVLDSSGLLALSDVYSRAAPPKTRLTDFPLKCCLKGALDKDRLFRLFQGTGFSTILWEDHTDLLKDFMFQAIWRLGSVDRFWGVEDEEQRERVSLLTKELKPGYYLAICRKI